MRLSLAISTALLFGSYVTAIPVWPNDSGASGSGTGNNFGAPAPHDATHFPPPNHPPPDHPPRFHPTLGYLPDPDHQFQPHQPPPGQQPDATRYLPPNHPPPGHPSLGHHNLPGTPEGPPPSHQVIGDSRGGLFNLPYRCTGCGHQSPGPEPGPGPGVDHPVPSTPANRNNRSPFIRTGQGGADRRAPSTRNHRTNADPYTRPDRSGAGGSNGGAVGVPHASGSTSGRGADGRFHCPDCGYSTPRADHLAGHAEIHSTQRNRHPCPIQGCGTTFLSERVIGRHVNTVHGDPNNPPNHRCPDCNLSFSRADAVQRHMRVQHGVPSTGRRRTRNAAQGRA